MHSSGRREGIQDSCLQAKEKTSRSVVSWHPDCGNITGNIPTKVVLSEVCKHYDLLPRVLIANRREYADERCIGIFIAHNITLDSSVTIGKVFHRDHSTILFNIKKGNVLTKDDKWRQDYSAIVMKILHQYQVLKTQGWVE